MYFHLPSGGLQRQTFSIKPKAKIPKPVRKKLDFQTPNPMATSCTHGLHTHLAGIPQQRRKRKLRYDPVYPGLSFKNHTLWLALHLNSSRKRKQGLDSVFLSFREFSASFKARIQC